MVVKVPIDDIRVQKGALAVCIGSDVDSDDCAKKKAVWSQLEHQRLKTTGRWAACAEKRESKARLDQDTDGRV